MRSSKQKQNEEAKKRIPLADLIETLRMFEEEEFIISAFLKSNGTDELERVKKAIREEIERRQQESL